MGLSGTTALVTGATGFIGGALARRLAGDGVKVRALARRPGRDSYIRDVAGIEIVQGDITDPVRMREVAQGCDYVFHAAAAMGGALDYQRKVSVAGARHVMLAAAEAKVRRVVHVSSIAVYGYGYPGDVTEDMPHRPGRVPYNIAKSESEAVVREVAAQHRLSYSIIRPALVYGPRSRTWTVRLFLLARRRPTLWLGDGSGHAHPIHIEDVVDLLLLLATHPIASGHAFNCAPDPPPTWREFLGGYANLAGHDRWLGIPIWLVRMAAIPIELYLTLRGMPQDAPAAISLVTGKTTFKMTKAREMLGWQPRIGLREGIESCAPYLREKGLLA